LFWQLHGAFQKHVQSALQYEGAIPPQALLDMLGDTIGAAASALLAHKPSLSNCITDHLTKKAIDSLQPLLGVTATYQFEFHSGFTFTYHPWMVTVKEI
jgi:hypothetical protein